MAYTGVTFDRKEQREMVIDAIAILLGDYSINRKYAAVLILKAFLPRAVVKAILNDDGIYPYERDDPRVRKWTKDILSRGKCEICGSIDDLEAHHIIKWADYPKGRIDPANGQCLCHGCHTNEHRYDQSYYMMAAKK